jgi:hypothetical protein
MSEARDFGLATECAERGPTGSDTSARIGAWFNGAVSEWRRCGVRRAKRGNA